MATVAACAVRLSCPWSSAAAAHRPQVMSCNELGWENLSAKKTPVIVLVASSTGDGDPPDNAAKFYVTMKCVLDCYFLPSGSRMTSSAVCTFCRRLPLGVSFPPPHGLQLSAMTT